LTESQVAEDRLQLAKRQLAVIAGEASQVR
jgi:hypothetical protein